MTKGKVGVVGFGWVGQANALALAADGYDVSFYDITNPVRHYEEWHERYNRLHELRDVLEADGTDVTYIVCVGDRVDEEGNQDITYIRAALKSLDNAKGTVVLRSTILPSSLGSLNFDIYLPEFLHERAAVRECINPQFVVIGRKSQAVPVPPFIETWRKRSVRAIECSPEEASHIKYLSNLWNALRIAFTNEFGSTITKPVTTEAVARIDKVMDFLFEQRSYRRYGKSFGGHCLPKDTRAYVRWCEEHGRDVPLLRSVLASNTLHRKKEELYPHLPRWYSKWVEPAGSGWIALHILGKSIERNLFHPIEVLKRRKMLEYRIQSDE